VKSSLRGGGPHEPPAHELLSLNGEDLEIYGAASFAGTAAEYIHCLWHDVTIRSGRDFLPARQLKARLDLLSRWFPPAPGHRLFPQAPRGGRR